MIYVGCCVTKLVSEGIWAIHEAPGGTLWLGSDRGLTHFDPASGAVHHFDQQEGLPGAIVYAVLPDEAGRLWVSTNQGLARFDPQHADAARRLNSVLTSPSPVL